MRLPCDWPLVRVIRVVEPERPSVPTHGFHDGLGRWRRRIPHVSAREYGEGGEPARLAGRSSHQDGKTVPVIVELAIVESLHESRPQVLPPRILKDIAGDYFVCVDRIVIEIPEPFAGRQAVCVEVPQITEFLHDECGEIGVDGQMLRERVRSNESSAAEPHHGSLQYVQTTLLDSWGNDTICPRRPEQEPAITPTGMVPWSEAQYRTFTSEAERHAHLHSTP